VYKIRDSQELLMALQVVLMMIREVIGVRVKNLMEGLNSSFSKIIERLCQDIHL